MELEFNKEGYPLIGFGKSVFFNTTGGPSVEKLSKKSPSNMKLTDEYGGVIGDYKYWNWGIDNLYPETALEDIGKSTVLSAGLKYKIELAMGQGVYPTKVISFDSGGREQLEVINSPELRLLARSRMVRMYLSNTFRDNGKLGLAFPVLRFNEAGDKCVGISVLNARSGRYEREEDNTSLLRGLIIADWRNPQRATRLPVLDMSDPEGHLDDLRFMGKTKRLNIVYPVANDFSNNYIYSEPDWQVAKNAGWLEISQSVPKMIKKIYTSQITWKWHIKIPYAYWEKKYPSTVYNDVKARQVLINTELDLFETNLIGEDNAGKAIITHFEINPTNGKAEEQWIIEPLDNKYKTENNLIDSAVADSYALFSINVNPTIMGAGMPGGGVYANKGGGSDIREAFLVNIALAWLTRQNALDPLECMTRFNGETECEWQFKNMLLTTLDSGSGSKDVVS
jgi:hypothetical protein